MKTRNASTSQMDVTIALAELDPPWIEFLSAERLTPRCSKLWRVDSDGECDAAVSAGVARTEGQFASGPTVDMSTPILRPRAPRQTDRNKPPTQTAFIITIGCSTSPVPIYTASNQAGTALRPNCPRMEAPAIVDVLGMPAIGAVLDSERVTRQVRALCGLGSPHSISQPMCFPQRAL